MLFRVEWINLCRMMQIEILYCNVFVSYTHRLRDLWETLFIVDFIMICEKWIVNFMYMNRFVFDRILVVVFSKLKSHCIHVLEMSCCVSTVTVDTLVDVEACSFFVVLQREVCATRIIRLRSFVKASRLLYYQYVIISYFFLL